MNLPPPIAIPAPLPRDEESRVRALHELRVLDTLPEDVYDDIVLLASQICGTPIGLISLIDSERQWFKARVGLGATETHRDLAFCAHAIVSPEPVFVVDDAAHDPRFRHSPLVTGDPHIRFYAGAPIVMPDGQSLGTVCVIDTVPRVLDAAQLRALLALSRQTTALLQLRQQTIVAQRQALALERASAEAAEARRRSDQMLEMVLRGGNLGLWDLDVPSGHFTINPRERVMLGYDAHEARSELMQWRSLVHPDDLAVVDAAIVPHLKGEAEFYACEHRMRHRGGQWVWVLMHGVIVERDVAGLPLRIVGTHMDVTSRLHNQQALQRATDLLQRMGAMARIGGWELDLPSGKIGWTDEVYRIHEVDPATELELVKNINFYAPEARPVIQAAVENAIAHGTPYDLQLGFITAKGRALTVRAQGEAVMQDGRAVRLFGTFQDITEATRTAQALQRSEQQLSLALSRPGLALFDWDVVADRMTRGANVAVMRGGAAQEQVCTSAEVSALVHPADLLAVRAAIRQMLKGETDGYDCEHRVRRLDGSWAWLRGVGRVTERGPDGRALHVSGTDEDVSARKTAELALADSQRRLRLLADNLPALIAYVDRDERYRYLNARVERDFGIDVIASLGRTMQEVRGDATYTQLAPHVAAALRGEAVTFTYDVQAGERNVHYQSNYVPDMTDTGRVRGFYSMTFDITELHETQRQLELLARVDSLTGLPNRRQFDERIAEVLLRSRRLKRPMAVMFLDIDHFKQINDSLGHAGGDAVLCEFAQRLARCLRVTDIVARLGGDEFVVLVEGVAGARDLGVLAEKIVACIRPTFRVAGGLLAVTTSIGVAACADGELAPAELLALADAALYQAKQQGRDGFAIA